MGHQRGPKPWLVTSTSGNLGGWHPWFAVQHGNTIGIYWIYSTTTQNDSPKGSQHKFHLKLVIIYSQRHPSRDPPRFPSQVLPVAHLVHRPWVKRFAWNKGEGRCSFASSYVSWTAAGGSKIPWSADAAAPVIWSRTIQKVWEMSLLKGLFSVFSRSKEEILTKPCGMFGSSQAELLRLAIARARRVGVELEQAEQLLQDEREAWIHTSHDWHVIEYGETEQGVCSRMCSPPRKCVRQDMRERSLIGIWLFTTSKHYTHTHTHTDDMSCICVYIYIFICAVHFQFDGQTLLLHDSLM